MTEFFLLTYIKSLFSDIITSIVVSILASIFAFFISMKVENKFGLYKYFLRLLNQFSEIQIRVHVSYHSNLPFNYTKDYIKSGFRSQYQNLRVYKDSSETLDFLVDNVFHVIVQNDSNNEMSVYTNKITTRVNKSKSIVHDFINILENIKEEVHKQNELINLKEKDFSLYLDLPYKDPFSTVYIPRNMTYKRNELEFVHNKSQGTMKIRSNHVSVHTKRSDDLYEIMENLV